MKRRSTRILLYLAVFLLLLVVFSPSHYKRAILHGNVNIDDYKIFSNRVIQIDRPIPWQHDSAYNSSEIGADKMAEFNKYGTTAFVVIQNNKIRYEAYWDGGSDTTRSNSFSAAKSIVSLLIGCAMDEGKIKSLDQPITD